ncbi:MAG: hypothetical protein NTV51_05700 [Verrucomicrobia bacterium]|nr:hypothetical protein [Verrucomicrobiota bacterium]
MTFPFLAGGVRHRRPVVNVKALVLILAMALVPGAEAAKPTWKPVGAEELAEAKPRLEPEAVAEVIFWNIDVDDRGFPRERIVTEYIRYKIFDPAKVDNITRISSVTYTGSDDRTETFARLALPDGRVQEFGKESIRERSLAKQGQEQGFLGWLGGGGPELKEKFLAITGVESGAVLEFQIRRVENYPSAVQAFVAQREGIPTRQMTFSCRTTSDVDQFNHRVFVFNKQTAQLNQDQKAKLITVTATDLPSVAVEPVMGPATDYALTILSCYDSRNLTLLPRSGKVRVPGDVPDKLGPWVFYSTLMNWVGRDRGWTTKRVKQLATEITADVADEAEKAKKIHEHVRALAQEWFKRPAPKTPATRAANSLDEVIDWAGTPDARVAAEDFLWLALALNQAAGLDAQLILLPNRQLSRFYRENVSPVFLPFAAVAVRLGGEWKFSSPHNRYVLPFGLVPWEQEGQVGLLALDRKEEFVPVPAAAPDKNLVGGMGVFEVDAEGTLSGPCRRSFTGHSAARLRNQLIAATGERRNEIAKGKFGFDTKLVELTITKIDGLEDSEKPLEFTATLRWPGFAVLTKDRMVVRVSVFHADGSTPFSATERRHPVHFPYRWQEIDRFTLRLPPEYRPEAPTAPPPMPGDVLSFRMQLAYEKEKNLLHVRRDFVSNLMDIAPAGYPQFKNWHAALSRADQHEVVFLRRAAGAAVPAEAPQR